MGKFIDLTNQKYGFLTVKERGENKYGKTAWVCICDCGKECLITSNDLRTGKRTSCGCKQKERAKITGSKNIKDISNKRYGFLTVIKATDKRASGGDVIWECICDCGNITYATKASLDRGDIKSCGCYRKIINQKDLIGYNFNKLTVIDSLFRKNEIPHILWKCKCDCGNELYVKPRNLLNGVTQSCGCLLSKGEQKLLNIFQTNNIIFEKQKEFSDCYFPDTKAKAKFDFFLPDYNLIIEYDGIQHYNFTNQGWNTEEHFLKTKQRDFFKNEWCKKNNISLIRISYLDYEKINYEYIKEKIYESTSIRLE